MTQIVHEFKEGVLCIVTGTKYNDSNRTDSNHNDSLDMKTEHWLRVEFKSTLTGATHCAEFNDQRIRGFCTILQSDPDLLVDFLKSIPRIRFIGSEVLAGFDLMVGSKTVGFVLSIPKNTLNDTDCCPRTDSNNCIQIINKMRQKINDLENHIKALEKRYQESNEMAGRVYENYHHQTQHKFVNDPETDKYYIGLIGDNPEYFHKLVDRIKCGNASGRVLLDMMNSGMLPRFKEWVINDGKPRIMINKYDMDLLTTTGMFRLKRV